MFDLKLFRIINGMTQRDAGEYFGCDQSFISMIEKGRNKMPTSFMSKIMSDPGKAKPTFHYPHGGLGGSIASDSKAQYMSCAVGAGVPYYDVDFIDGIDTIGAGCINPLYYINFPQYNKAECWVNVTGHSMEPLINHGDMIALRKLEDWPTYMLYGEIYAIVTDEYRTVKQVKKSPRGDGFLRLVPANGEYDEQDIPTAIIRHVYQVIGSAKRIF